MQKLILFPLCLIVPAWFYTHTNKIEFVPSFLLPLFNFVELYQGQLKTLVHMEKPYFRATSSIYLRRDVIALSLQRYGSFDRMLAAKKKADRKKPQGMASSVFYDKITCPGEWGDRCTCGHHEGYSDRWCEECQDYHYDDY